MRLALAVAGIQGAHRRPKSAQRRIEGHLKALSNMATLCAIYDTDPQQGRNLCAEHSVPYYDDLDAMISGEKFDGAVVVNPDKVAAYSPVSAVSRLLCAKKHVFSEWPISYDAAKCESLLHLAARRKVVLECGRMWESDMTSHMICDMALEKKYGRLLMADIHNRHGKHVIYDAARDMDSCDSDDVCTDVPDTSYVHDAYLANRLAGAMPHVVFARFDDAPDAQPPADGSAAPEPAGCSRVVIGYDGGMTAVLSSNMITPGDDLRMEVHFERAVVNADLVSGEILVHKGSLRAKKLRAYTVRYDEHIFVSISEFVEAAESKKVCASAHVRDVIASVRVAKAALLSGRRGIPIYLDLRLQE